MPDCCCLETYTASADATASDTANNGQTVTSSASSTASSTLNYEDAYAVAHSNAKSVAKSVAENNTNIINQSFPGLITLKNLKSSKNVYNIHDNSNYYYIKGSSGNSTKMPPAFFSLGEFFSSILASAVDSKGNLYIGGSSIGNIETNELSMSNRFSSLGFPLSVFSYVAMWDGSTWSPLGTGLGGTVRAIAIDKSDNVYFGGDFTTLGDGRTVANRVAKWTPSTSTWSVLGPTATNGVSGVYISGTPVTVNALAIDSSNNVYAGGNFTTLGDGVTIANYIAKWTLGTATWSVLGPAATNGLSAIVNALVVDSSNNVYVGGQFSTLFDTTSANYIAKWTPTGSGSWSILGTSALNGVRYYVYALAVDSNNNIYVGGNFVSLGGSSTTIANNIAKWSPSGSGSWTVLGNVTVNGVNNNVTALAVDSNNNVYVGGQFTNIYTGSTVSNGTNNQVTASTTITFKEPTTSTLFVGMGISITGIPTNNLTIVSITDQKTIIVSSSNVASTITVPENTVIYFSYNPARYIAKWTPSTSSWSTVGNQPGNSLSYGLNDIPNTITIYKSTNTIYAGDSTGNQYQLFSDYVNLQYNGVTLQYLYLDGQTVTIYTNNKNGKKVCYKLPFFL